MSIHKRGKGYVVRYREGSKNRSKTFDLQIDRLIEALTEISQMDWREARDHAGERARKALGLCEECWGSGTATAAGTGTCQACGGLGVRKGRKAMWDREMAVFCLGEPGEHFDQAEWDRRATLLIDQPGPYLRGERETTPTAPKENRVDDIPGINPYEFAKLANEVEIDITPDESKRLLSKLRANGFTLPRAKGWGGDEGVTHPQSSRATSSPSLASPQGDLSWVVYRDGFGDWTVAQDSDEEADALRSENIEAFLVVPTLEKGE